MKDKRGIYFMKNYKVTVTATVQKDVFITAGSLQNAYDEAFEMFMEDELYQFENEDIIAFTGEVAEDLDDDIFGFDCDNCPYCCDECGACFYDEEDDEDYIDEEFELRKSIFKEYLKNTYDEIIEYANSLFGEE